MNFMPGADHVPTLDTDTLTDWYETMVLMREFDNRTFELHRSGELRGSLHACAGFESSAIATCRAAIEPGDVVFSHHRPFGHSLATELDPRLIMAELYGRREGYCHGRGGSKHMAAVDKGFLGAGGIIAGMLPIAVGAAYAMKLDQPGRLVLAFFGDGAVNQGVFHEAVNLGVVFKAPVLFVCENNFWAENTPTPLYTAGESISARAKAYGMYTATVSTADVSEIYETVKAAADHVRSESTPAFVEVQGFRVGNHSVGVMVDARDADEMAQAVASDPIPRLEQWLLDNGVLKAELERRRAHVAEVVEDSVTWARNLPSRKPADAFEEVYA